MKIIISKTPKSSTVETKGTINFTDAMDMLMGATLTTIRGFIDQAPPQEQDNIKNLIYDKFNEDASTILNHIVPTRELRPDMTEQAILAQQDLIMQHHLKNKDNA